MLDRGDSIFIELPNKMTMLIDAGEASFGEVVASYISSLGYSRIDYLIGTHPHSDHIGGLAYLIQKFDIGKIYMPKVIATSKTYENLLDTIVQKDLKVSVAKAGITILEQGSLKVDIVAPNQDSYQNLNNYSAVLKITYGKRKFLFMGDAEVKSEREIMTDVSADVVKVGHHGSDTSSGLFFVDKVRATYAIVMVGSDNYYHHPCQDIMGRWSSRGTKVYRTDLDGTILVKTDGEMLEISDSR